MIRGLSNQPQAMLARTLANLSTEGAVTNSSSANALNSGEQKLSERDRLLYSLVRRYLLLAQTSPAEWNKNESALLLLADSILGRYVLPSDVR